VAGGTVSGFLNTVGICDSGIVSEDNLRQVYDAYTHSMAKMFTDRWLEPDARLCSPLFPSSSESGSIQASYLIRDYPLLPSRPTNAERITRRCIFNIHQGDPFFFS
jgi:hypothetical protein